MSTATHEGAAHDHTRLYVRTGVTLTLITAAEVGILFVEPLRPLFTPLLVVMAIVKFLMVVGTFMHLRDDRRVYSLLFFAPLFTAIALFIALGLLAVNHYAPFGKGWAVTAMDQREGFQLPGAGAGKEEAPWSEDRMQAAFAAATPELLAKGEQTYKTMCASCHRPDGGGMPGLGPNMTDDCYIHGGQLTALYATISEGVPGKAMPAWKTSMSPEQRRDVTFYVRSLRGKPAVDGRPCEGSPAK